jgi:ABC-2 type transport system ATP-binding protein
VLHDITFDIRPGEVTGLLGPNGAGKSTLLRIIVGILEARIGRVEVQGFTLPDEAFALKKVVGYVPEAAELYETLSALEFLEFCGRLHGIEEASLQRRIEALLTGFGLIDERLQRLGAYSKGMRQKVLISAALLHNPAIVILDEPNSGLDVTTTFVLRSLVQTLAAEGRMVIYSSHVLESVERVATDVIILNDGRVVAHDSVSRLRELMELASLEQVFRQLVIETDIDGMASDLVAVMKL